MTGPFQAGAQLCEQFYWRCVRPILEMGFPGLPHAAALIDNGSEVLGFDDVMSTDHHWGPRVLLFLQPTAHPRFAQAVHAALAQQLPYEFEGYPTNFTPPNAGDHGVQRLERLTHGPVNHRVPCHTFQGFVAQHFNPISIPIHFGVRAYANSTRLNQVRRIADAGQAALASRVRDERQPCLINRKAPRRRMARCERGAAEVGGEQPGDYARCSGSPARWRCR